MKENKTYKTSILNGEKEEEVVGLDTHSFEYFKAMCDCWSKEDLQYRAWEICVECIENNIINELEKYINVNLFCYCEEDLNVFEDLKEDILNIIHEDNKPYKLELEE